MDKNIFQLLKRYLTGNISSTDRTEINNWYDNLNKADARFTNAFEKRKVKEDLWAHIVASSIQSKTNQSVFRFWQAAAAVLLITTVGLWYVVNNQNATKQLAYFTINVPTGETRQVTLTDGSQVWLNSGATLKYPKKFSDTARLVSLLRGEAFFKISKDSSRPFRITSQKITTSVVGTSFNIRTLRTSGLYQISVMTGKVKISSGSALLATLTKNTGLTAGLYTGQKLSNSTHSEATASWMSGEISLESVSYKELADVIEQYYGIQLKSVDADVLDGSYSLKFNKRDNIETLVEIISSVNGMQYTRKGNQIIIN